MGGKCSHSSSYLPAAMDIVELSKYHDNMGSVFAGCYAVKN